MDRAFSHTKGSNNHLKMRSKLMFTFLEYKGEYVADLLSITVE
jgi:hypothetical protein